MTAEQVFKMAQSEWFGNGDLKDCLLELAGMKAQIEREYERVKQRRAEGIIPCDCDREEAIIDRIENGEY